MYDLLWDVSNLQFHMAAYTLGNAPSLQCDQLSREHLGPIPALLAATMPPMSTSDSLDSTLHFRIKLGSLIDNFFMFTPEILYANMALVQFINFLHILLILIQRVHLRLT